MVYIDETGAQIDSYDLKKGYLVEAEWVDHPSTEQVGHYEYTELNEESQLQTFVVDVPAQSAWREVTVLKYIRYTEEELAQMNASPSIEERLTSLEEIVLQQ